MYSDQINRPEKLSTLKYAVVQYAILAMILALTAGLWRLQVVGANNFKVLAEQNRIRKVPVLAARGKLFDRDNHLVVDNYPSVSLFLVRELAKNVDADLPSIAKGLDLDLEDLRSTLHRYRTAPGYQPIPLKQDITADQVAFVEAHRNEYPELETIDEERRLYPRDGFASHLIGYVGEVSEEDLNTSRYAAYEQGAVVGKAGVESTYDEVLRGEDGSRDVIVDSHGREVGFMGVQHAKPGQDLRLTIDIDVQRTAELALGQANGAVIAMDPRNGEILAWVSRPSFDPNAFAVRIGRKEWNELITNPSHPLMNKPIQDQLAPGSTFKIIMSAAGLEEGVAQDMRVNCTGGGNFYGRFFHCDKHHGVLAIHDAISLSCDTFFYTLAQKLGIDTIAHYATNFGLGTKTGIDLPGEMSGLMPSSAWSIKSYHQKYYAGNTISVGIGQGETQVTPMQLLRALSGIASQGHFVRPHVVFPEQLPENFRTALNDSFPGSGVKNFPLKEETWMTITEGMAAAATTGTAAAAHLDGIDFAGKTGTAQVTGTGDTHVKGGSKTPNSWFVGMVPRRNPEFAIVVLQEHGDWGANSAIVAAKVVNTYVTKKRRAENNLHPDPVVEKPMEMGAVWSTGTAADGKTGNAAPAQTNVQGGTFLVNHGQATPVKPQGTTLPAGKPAPAATSTPAGKPATPATSKPVSPATPAVGKPASPAANKPAAVPARPAAGAPPANSPAQQPAGAPVRRKESER